MPFLNNNLNITTVVGLFRIALVPKYKKVEKPVFSAESLLSMVSHIISVRGELLYKMFLGRSAVLHMSREYTGSVNVEIPAKLSFLNVSVQLHSKSCTNLCINTEYVQSNKLL